MIRFQRYEAVISRYVCKRAEKAIKIFRKFSGVEERKDFMYIGFGGEKETREIKGVMMLSLNP
ncbi:MAG: hypothetical protein GX660_10700 [Clostridiaceae bacterium]|nr:hypothetical protein [Clostridiaceae bacterium]